MNGKALAVTEVRSSVANAIFPLQACICLDPVQDLIDQEVTFGLLKPDIVQQKKADEVLSLIAAKGLRVLTKTFVHFSPEQARQFYAEHKGKLFFEGLVSYMSSGLSAGMILVGEDAIKKWRDLMGPTNPEQARLLSPDSIRAQFGQDITYNGVHGSDSKASAAREIRFFCQNFQICTNQFSDA